MPLEYAQFCPLARAAEIVGERWTLLIVRELLMGPQRFTDLRERLPGVSPSVLAERLARLEERGVVGRRTLDPPAASAVYELTELGRGLQPAIAALARWGARFLGLPRPGEQLEPRMLRLGLHFLAPLDPTPARCVEVRLPDGEGEMAFRLRGGPHGTRVEDAEPGRGADAIVHTEPFALVALVAGVLAVDAGLAQGALRAEGDLAAVRDLPALFRLTTGDGPEAPSPQPE